jgi:hypothetical protein
VSTDPSTGPAAGKIASTVGEVSPPLRLPANILDALLAATVAFGRHDQETGGFLLADDQDVVRALALTGESGIERHRGLFMVSGVVVERVCEWAAGENLRVAALVHTHKGHAGMSRTDRNNGFRVDGFRSVIIPSFANPPTAPIQWGWYAFEHGDWHLDHPGELIDESDTAGSACVIVVDEDGVR